MGALFSKPEVFMKKALFAISGILLLSFMTFCEHDLNSYKGEPNILSFLSNDSAKILVKVGKTHSINDTLKYVVEYDTFRIVEGKDTVTRIWESKKYLWNGVHVASVSLKQGTREYTLVEDKDTVGYYWTKDSIKALPGEHWELKVLYSDGEHISTSTTVPDTVKITSPLKDTISSKDTLKWVKPTGSAGYFIRFLFWEKYEIPEKDTTILSSSSYTILASDTLNPLALKEYLFGGDSCRITIIALDTNAYDYHCYGEINDDGKYILDDYMHIKGAWGAFGSQSAAHSKVYIIEREKQPPLE